MEIQPLITQQQIAERVAELARSIREYIGSEDTVVIANLKGSVIFFSDLVRQLDHNLVSLDFMATESYQGTESSGEVRITHDLSINVAGKKVLLVEDILDTGLTLAAVNRYIKEVHRPSQLKVCVLLNKQERRCVDLKADFIGFEIQNQFVIGYGLDYQQKYRNLPYIGLFNPDTVV